MLKRKSNKQKHCNQEFVRSLIVMPAALIVLFVILTGCANTTKLYPITDKDIFFQDNGNVCMSPFYMEEVLKAKVNK